MTLHRSERVPAGVARRRARGEGGARDEPATSAEPPEHAGRPTLPGSGEPLIRRNGSGRPPPRRSSRDRVRRQYEGYAEGLATGSVLGTGAALAAGAAVGVGFGVAFGAGAAGGLAVAFEAGLGDAVEVPAVPDP